MTLKRLTKTLGSNFSKVDVIDFLPDTGFGEAGYMLHLKDGYSFDPMAEDLTRFIPAGDLSEADNLVIFNYSAAEKSSAAANNS
jgi:hypothetical protein